MMKLIYTFLFLLYTNTAFALGSIGGGSRNHSHTGGGSLPSWFGYSYLCALIIIFFAILFVKEEDRKYFSVFLFVPFINVFFALYLIWLCGLFIIRSFKEGMNS